MNRPSLFFPRPFRFLFLPMPSAPPPSYSASSSAMCSCTGSARRAVHLFSEFCCLSVAFILFVAWFDRTFKSCRRGAIGASRRRENGGGWLLFRIKGDLLSRSDPDRVLSSSLDLLSFNVRMSYYLKPLDETFLNPSDPSSLSAERFCETETSRLPPALFYLLRLSSDNSYLKF